MDQATSVEVNSREWWDTYHHDEWDAHEGRDQTRGFMRALLLNVPDHVLAYLLANTLSVLDWGCAQGDGVDVLAQAFPACTVCGLDFSKNAISAARSAFPEYMFLQTDGGAIAGTYDVICTLNCLEHFAQPLAIVAEHLNHCQRMYLALVPYNEYPLSEQHMAQFSEESFPEHIGAFTRIASSPIDVPAVYWPDKQLLVVYVHRDYLQDVTAAGLLADRTDIVRLREALLSAEERTLYRELGRLHREINRLWRQEVAPRDAQLTEMHKQATAEQSRTEQRLAVWQTKAKRFRTRYNHERKRASNLATERDTLRSHVQLMASTKAWRLTTAYWRLRRRGLVGWLQVVVIVLGCIIFSPLIVIGLLAVVLYKMLVPYRIRLKVSVWLVKGFSRRTRRAAVKRIVRRAANAGLMPKSSYAFVRYKQKRAQLCPGGVTALRTPATSGLVSIILPVYNGADMLRESLASILSQTYQRFEVIAINDGSTDESADILEEYARKDERIRVLHQENRKIPRTLSRGMRAAQGEFLTWTSCDNRMKSDFLEQLVASLNRHPDWDMVYANMDIIGEDGQPLRDSGWYEGYQQPHGSEHIYLPADITQLNVDPNNYVGGAFMYRSRAAWLLGEYSPIRFTTEDYDYWMRLNSLLTLRHADVDTPLYEYRFHSASLTTKDADLGITAGRPKLMAFEDFRRDFQLSPLIWVIETVEPDSAANEVTSALRKRAADRGDLIMSTAELASYRLPTLWVPVVFVQVGPKSSVSVQPLTSLPDQALRVLVVADDGQLDTEDDPACAWDMCVAFGARTDLGRIGDGYVGWFGCGDPSTLLTALDVRARSHHEALIEQEIARCSSQPAQRKVSFVICGYKRPEPVVQAVHSVAFQTMPQSEYEVIVVNNDVTDRTLADRIAEVRAAWFPEHPESLRYVDNPIQGLSSARNAGIAEAEGEVVSFLDDDALAPSTFAEQIWCILEQHPEIGLLGGHIRLTAPDPAPEALHPGFEPYWGHYQTTYDKLTTVEQWYDFPWGSNWSARRLALLHIGGFRTRYGRLGADFGGGEELVAAALIQSIGYQIAVSPDCEVLHAPEPHRYTWEHVKRTIMAGTLTQYMMELDGYIPASLGMLWAIREAVKPTLSPTRRKGRVGRRLRAYRSLAFIRLAREHWHHRRARHGSGLEAIEANCHARR